MLSEDDGPLMIDLTDLVRKRPIRKPAFGTMIALRDIAVGSIGIVVALPITMFFYGIGVPVIGNLVAVAGIVVSLFIGSSKPDGQTIPQYVKVALLGRVGRTEVDGHKTRVHVGICPVEIHHDGDPVRIINSAVFVNSDRVGPRGNLLPSDAPGIDTFDRDDDTPVVRRSRTVSPDGIPYTTAAAPISDTEYFAGAN